MSAAKKQPTATRTVMYQAAPEDLCIIGGRSLPKAEQGRYDTELDESHALHDARLAQPLLPEFINNIDAHGVDTPILATTLEGVLTVVAGRSRVRAARLVNQRRRSRGEPLLKIDCKIKRGPAVVLMGAMITENEARRDDDMLAKLAKLKSFMNRGVSLADAALSFNVTVNVAKSWLALDDHATKATRKALANGRISASAALALAKTRDPVLQQKALDVLLNHAPASKGSARNAKRAVSAARTGQTVLAPIPGPAPALPATTLTHANLTTFLAAVQAAPHPSHSSPAALAWWDGVEEALQCLVVDGEGAEVDARLAALWRGIRGA